MVRGERSVEHTWRRGCGRRCLSGWGHVNAPPPRWPTGRLPGAAPPSAGARLGRPPTADRRQGTQENTGARERAVSTWLALPEFCVLEQLSSTARRALGARPICPERSVRLTSVPQLNPGVSWTWATSATSARRRLAGRIATDTGRGPRSSWRCVRAEGRAGNPAPVAGWPWWVAVTWRSPFSVWSAQGVDADEVSLGVGTSTGRRRGRQPGGCGC